MTELLLKEESYKIIGLCMEVHRQLGPGFQETVYKDALAYELKESNIPYVREKGFRIPYKQIVLERRFYADFIVYENILLEVKATSMLVTNFTQQTLNYLKASDLHLG
ncbi:MAG: GxxExxY protein, partial [Chitinophagaceae bacterium]